MQRKVPDESAKQAPIFELIDKSHIFAQGFHIRFHHKTTPMKPMRQP
jgi:hypothetical protein